MTYDEYVTQQQQAIDEETRDDYASSPMCRSANLWEDINKLEISDLI